jgi:hypothetical protein
MYFPRQRNRRIATTVSPRKWYRKRAAALAARQPLPSQSMAWHMGKIPQKRGAGVVRRWIGFLGKRLFLCVLFAAGATVPADSLTGQNQPNAESVFPGTKPEKSEPFRT